MHIMDIDDDDTDDVLYRVLYEDGDAEDTIAVECTESTDPYMKLQL